MKKKIFLSAAELCLSLALVFDLTGGSLSGQIYAQEPDGEIQLITAEGVKQSGQWLYFDRDDHISVCGYSGTDEHVTIPSEIDGKTVTELSYGGAAVVYYSRSFFGLNSNSNFDSIDSSEDVKAVTKHITIPNTVTKIGEYTFSDCRYLEQADLPEGLTYIGSSAFEGCSLLAKADIPSTVTVIKNNAFVSTAIDSLVLPEGLEYIGDSAFFNTEITQLKIPDSVKYIGSRAFGYCWSLEEVTLSENITVIPQGIFTYCLKLRSLEIPEGVQIIEPYAFEWCSGLETLYIPSTVTIMSEMLSDNSSLKDIYFNFDSETAAAMTGSDTISYFAVYGDKTDYSNVALHYAEKSEPAPQDPLWDNPVRAVFLILGITFFLTFIAALCLYLVQKSKLSPKPAPKAAPANIPQGNALTGLSFLDGVCCKKCGAESGKIADYCYNCGKKLKKKQ